MMEIYQDMNSLGGEHVPYAPHPEGKLRAFIPCDHEFLVNPFDREICLSKQYESAGAGWADEVSIPAHGILRQVVLGTRDVLGLWEPCEINLASLGNNQMINLIDYNLNSKIIYREIPGALYPPLLQLFARGEEMRKFPIPRSKTLREAIERIGGIIEEGEDKSRYALVPANKMALGELPDRNYIGTYPDGQPTPVYVIGWECFHRQYSGKGQWLDIQPVRWYENTYSLITPCDGKRYLATSLRLNP